VDDAVGATGDSDTTAFDATADGIGVIAAEDEAMLDCDAIAQAATSAASSAPRTGTHRLMCQ
jgi:hypothetical protein